MRLALLAPVLVLAACDSGPEMSVENATPEEVAAKMKESGVATDLRKPGRWKYTTTIVDVQSPSMPAEMLEQMRTMMGNGQTMERCVTQDEIDKVDAFVGQNDSNCTFEKYEVGGGTVSGKARCEQGGMKQVMTMDGSYTPSSSDMTITSEMSGGPGPAGDVKMKMNIKSERVGDC